MLSAMGNIGSVVKLFVAAAFIAVAMCYTSLNSPDEAKHDIRCDDQIVSYFPNPMKKTDAAKFCAGLGGELVDAEIVENTNCLKDFVEGNPVPQEVHNLLHTTAGRFVEGELCPEDEHFVWDIFGLVDIYRKNFFDYCNLPLPFACQFPVQTYSASPSLSVGIPASDDDK